jgi:DNA-binding response OmpR family regulator
MLTAVTHELNRRLSESVMGASAYITKPFEASELLTTVHEVLERAKGPVDHARSAVTGA